MWKKREECQKFRHYGLQRSGTNLLEGLMYRYFEVWCRNGGSGPIWKHSLEMADLEEDLFYLVIAKNPYLWIESIAFRNPMDYIEKQTRYPAREEIDPKYIAGPNQINVINAAKTWNHFYTNWCEEDEDKVLHIRYEDLLLDKQKVLDEIHKRFHCEWRKNPEQYKSRETSILNRKQSDGKTEYYISERPEKLSEDQISVISDNIDPFLFKLYKYDHL